MPTLTLIRDEIGPDCRKVLSHIWLIFLEIGEWPSSRRIRQRTWQRFRQRSESKTNGSVVFESLNNGSKQYHLVGVAPLLTNDAAVYQQPLLTRYLELLRLIYRIRLSQHVFCSLANHLHPLDLMHYCGGGGGWLPL